MVSLRTRLLVAASAAALLASLAPSLAFAPPQPRSYPPTAGVRNGVARYAGVETASSRGSGTAAIISGSPSAEARSIDIREALSQSTVLRLDGSPVSVSDLMSKGDDGVSFVVLTRSFGWPFCQEQILQYSSRRVELLENGVEFALISIGEPEVGLRLCEHLNVEGGEEWIYADPENDAYDRLRLNRGWDTMIRPATAFRFRDRIFGGKGSLDQLFEVLGKWKDAVYVPPKIEQSTNHGGTFIFSGDEVIFAHYDESPGTHADTFEAVELAVSAARKRR